MAIQEHTHYYHNKTGKRISVIDIFPYSSPKTNWEWIDMCHCLTEKGIWKYIKASTIEKLYHKGE